MFDQFNYHAKYILKGMNSIEDMVGKMFHEVLPEFEKNFWLAHDKKDVQSLKKLGRIMDKIIDDLKAGNSFVLDRVKEGKAV
jgi:hypothetical protein